MSFFPETYDFITPLPTALLTKLGLFVLCVETNLFSLVLLKAESYLSEATRVRLVLAAVMIFRSVVTDFLAYKATSGKRSNWFIYF